MLALKIISLIFVFILSILQFRQERTFVKWGGITLCAAILVIGIADLVSTQKEQQYFSSRVLKDASRILWEKTTAHILLMNNKNNIKKGAQQIVLKIIPTDIELHGNIKPKELLSKLESSAYGYDYIPEELAEKLWNAMAEPDGSIYFEKEKDVGIESVYFSESQIEEDLFQGVDVELRVQHIPTALSKYTSIHDIKGKIIVARIAVKTIDNPYIGWVRVNLETRAGPLILHFPPKQIANGKLISSYVRYVGIFLDDEKFRF